MVQPKPRPGADPRAQEIKALKGMVAEQACTLDEQTCKLDEQTDQIVLLINENIDLRATIVRLNEDKEELEVELRLRKKASPKPDIKPPDQSGKVRGGLAGQEKGKGKGGGGAAGKRRRGRKRGRDTAERVEVLIKDPPKGSHRKDFVERYVQVLRIDTQHVVYRLERRILPDGTTVTAELPTPATGNFSSTVESFALLAYHEGQSTMPRVARMLRGFGLDISGRQVKRLPAQGKDPFIREADAVLRAGVAGAQWLSVDDTGGRHEGRASPCTSLGNDRFCIFRTTRSKSRLNFIDLLCSGLEDHVIDAHTLQYWRDHALVKRAHEQLSEGESRFRNTRHGTITSTSWGSSAKGPASSPPGAPATALSSTTDDCVRAPSSSVTAPASSTSVTITPSAGFTSTGSSGSGRPSPPTRRGGSTGSAVTSRPSTGNSARTPNSPRQHSGLRSKQPSTAALDARPASTPSTSSSHASTPTGTSSCSPSTTRSCPSTTMPASPISVPT